MPLKTNNQEDEYFAKQEAIKLRKLALRTAQEMSDAEKKKLKEQHFMHCPKCGMKMHVVHVNGIEVDKCFACGGLYFDEGELEKVSGREGSFFDTVHEMLDK